jgi:hypothetical protein
MWLARDMGLGEAEHHGGELTIEQSYLLHCYKIGDIKIIQLKSGTI